MSDQSKDEPFFIGWEAKPAAPISAFLKKTVLLLVIAGIGIAGAVTAMQKTVSTGKFDFGNLQAFTGVLVKRPAPMLISDTEVEGERIFYLVSLLKRGFPVDVAEEHHLRHVTLNGTFIGDEHEAMIEVVAGSVADTGRASANSLRESTVGQVTIRGEIVDSKCHLGVMNPGRFKPHRACAIQCITGGIPPILVARTPDGQLAHYLLIGADGSPVNDGVIDYVAEPVEISGTLKKIGDRKVVFIDPATITRLRR